MAALMDYVSAHPTSVLVLLFACLYCVGVAVYRLYFSPLAKFPGPRFAALTFGWEFYHDVVRRGQYTFEIVKMHEKYGPIVRINPNQLHIKDVDYYDEVFPGGHKPTDKAPSASGIFGNSLSVISTVPHSLHKMRRAALNPFFSKRSVAEYAGIIQSAVSKLCARFGEFHTAEVPLDLRVAFAALTGDVISMYSYGWSHDSLGKPDLEPEFYRGFMASGEFGLLLKHYPWIYNIIDSLPDWLVPLLNGNALAIAHRKKRIQKHVQAIMSNDKKDQGEAKQSPTIFHELIKSDIPAEEKSMARLIDEGITLIGAGTITSAHVLSTTAYHILANPKILQRLQKELQEAMPIASEPLTQTPLAQLERLPYLTAVIKEGLRLTHAISHRNTRVAQNRSLKFRQWTIPPGTAVSMTTYMLDIDPTVFPAPQEFRPERWLPPPPQGVNKRDDPAPNNTPPLEKYLLPFGKGSRICLGMNLAYAELYMTLAAVFRRFELSLFETTRQDVEVVHDFVAGSARLDSKGVRVMVVGTRH